MEIGGDILSELLIFDPADNLLAVLSKQAEGACDFWSAPFRELVNNGSFFEFIAQGDHEDSQYLVAENQVAFEDKDGYFRLFVIKEPDQTNGINGPQIHCVCEPAMNELNEELIEDVRPYNTTLADAQSRALAGTRWKPGITAVLGINSINYYYISVNEAIQENINTWGGEIRDRIEIEDNKIVGRYIDILPRRGQDTGKIWEIDKDILFLSHKVQSYPKTALYGRGASLETENGGFTRKITFADVEWKVSKGDPVDKPKGQEWVGDPEALAAFGRLNEDGTKRHRKGRYENGEQEDPVALLLETWEALQQQKHQFHNYEMDVFLLEQISGYEHEKVRLGDTTIAIDRSFANPIEIEERVISYEYDVSDPDNTGKVELGQFIDLYSDDDRLDQLEAQLNDKSGIWDRGGGPVTDDKIENVTPPKTMNVIASGGFQNILVEWDFVSTIYIANYEVYASQIQGFTPDPSNLVFRGKTSTYSHQAATNEQWYFRVRALNTHGVPGELSDEAMAQTARVISDDILFGPEIAEKLRELSETAGILADGSVGLEQIKQDALDAIQAESRQYTDAEILATETSIMSELANKTGFDYVDGKLYLVNQELLSKVDNGVYENKMLLIDSTLESLSIRAESIEANVNTLTGEVNTAKSQIASLDIKADGISTSVSEVRADLDGLQIGGRNLYKNTSDKFVTASWNNQWNVYPASPSYEIPVSPGETITVRVYYRNVVGIDVTVRIFWIKSDGSMIESGNGNVIKVGEEGYSTVTLTAPADVVRFRVPLRRGSLTGSGTAEYKELKVEKGNKATDWTPAPEDLDSRVSSAETRIDQNATQIGLKASQTSVDNLTGRMSQAESSINLMTDEISLKVDRDDVIASINLQPGTVKIKAALIDLVGDVYITNGQTRITNLAVGTAAIANAAITNAKIGTLAVGTGQIQDAAITNAKIANASIDNAKIISLSADKLNAGAIRGIDIWGSKFRSSDGNTNLEIVGANVRLTQSTGNYVNINPDGIFGYNSGGSERFRMDKLLVTSAALGTSNSNVYLAPDSENEARVVNVNSIPSDGAADSYSYRPIRALGYRFKPGTNGYIGTDLELRVTSLGFTQENGSVIYRPVRAEGYIGDYFDSNSQTAGVNIFVRPAADAELRVTTRGSTTNYRPVRGSRAYFTGIATNTASGGTHLYLGADGEIRCTSVAMTDNASITWRNVAAAGYYGDFIEISPYTGSNNMYVRASNEVRATKSGTTGTYIPIRASEILPPSSSRETKTDINTFEENVIPILRDINFYSYLYKWDEPQRQKRLGVMIEDVPRILHGEQGDSIELYAYASYIGKGVKDLIAVTDNHADELNWLKIDNQYLMQKVNVLEQRIKNLEDRLDSA